MRAPDDRGPSWYRGSIQALQVLSIVLMWAFLGAVVVWIVNMVQLSLSLGDALTVSVGISLVVIPVYSLVAGVLTYVFFGLQRGRRSGDD